MLQKERWSLDSDESTQATLSMSAEVPPARCRRVWFDVVPRFVVPDYELGLTDPHEPGMFDSCTCIEDPDMPAGPPSDGSIIDLDLHWPIIDLPPAGPPSDGSVDPPTWGPGSMPTDLAQETEETAEAARVCRPEGKPCAGRPQRRMGAVA
jgi:hypothetical protein